MQMVRYLTALFTLSLVSLCSSGKAPSERSPLENMRNMMKNIRVDNGNFVETHKDDDVFFKKQQDGQSPRATIVSCSDSRVHTTNFDTRPLGDVFFIRNIGNQFEPCLGSIEYGVLHKHTPLLLFLGHSKCGAVIAVTEGTDSLESSIRDELAPMRVTHHGTNLPDIQIKENIAENVHRQVNKAYEKYHELIRSQCLWVVGAVYDFTTDGKGALKIIQVNDKVDDDFIQAFLEDIDTHGVLEEPL